MGYKHLTKEQRYSIEVLLQTPMSLRDIGEVIGVSTDPRKSLGYRTPLDYCKQLFNFDF